MNIHTLSAVLAAILTFVVGWSVILRDRRQRSFFAFAVLCFNLSGWYLLHFFSTALESAPLDWISLAFAALIPSSTERFFRAFLADDRRRVAPLSRHVVVGTVAVYGMLLVGVIFPVHQQLWFLVPLFLFVFGSLFYCMFLLYQRQRSVATRPQATRLRYLLYGGTAAVTLAATDFLPRIGVAFPTIGNVLTVIYVYFISQTLFHYRLLDIKELLGKMTTLGTLVLILSVVYNLLVLWVSPDKPGVFLFNTVVASFVIMVIFEPLRSWLEDRLNRYLFAEKYEFARRLRQLSRDLPNIIEERPLVFRVLAELEASGRVTHAAIFLLDPSQARYRLAGHIGPEPSIEIDTSKHWILLERLHRQGALTVEELEQQATDEATANQSDASASTRNVIATLEELHADVCIALSFEGRLLGLLCFGDERIREAYAGDELDRLKNIALQVAITLRNSQVYEQLKERDRLAALGQMAAGLAHEIRNPLGAIKGAAQLLQDDIREVEQAAVGESREYIDIIVEEVDRLDHVVAQFLGYARPDRGQRDALNINTVVHKTIQLLKSRSPVAQIKSELASDLPLVRADADQLRQVFLNLALNGFQAMDDGELTIGSRVRSGYRAGRSVDLIEVSFSDHGKGIAEDQLARIFVPFYTTRSGGTGLGLPICQRIIENHGGTIEVQSEVGKGSTFRVVLPGADAVDATGAHVISRTGKH